MKPGDPVKIKCNSGNGDYWRVAKLLPLPEWATEGRCVQINEPGQVGYCEVVMENHKVKRFDQLPYDEETGTWPALESMVRHDFADLQETIKNALEALIPDEKFTVDDGIIYGYHKSVSLEPAVIELESIGAFMEKPGWTVTIWKSYPDTRTEPGGMEDAPVGQYYNYAAAAQAFVETIFRLKSEDYWTREGESIWGEDIL